MADRVKDGIFGAMMEVSLVNDVSAPSSPVRLSLKSRVSMCIQDAGEALMAGHCSLQSIWL